MNKHNKNNVLILVENSSVPGDVRVRKISNALISKGYIVSVICPKGKHFDKKTHEIVNNVAIYRYYFFEAKSNIIAYIIEYIYSMLMMLIYSIYIYIFKRFKIIHICNPPDLLIFIALPFKLFGVKIIFDQHDLTPETYISKKGNNYSKFIYRILLMFEKITYSLSNIVIATNESYKGIAINRGKLNINNVIVVRNGPDPNRIKIVDKSNELKKDKDYLIYYVGTMGKQDGVDYLLRAIYHLNKYYDNFIVMLVGGGSEYDNLINLTKKLNLMHCVKFTGRINDDEMLKILNTADLCVSPDPNNPLNNVSTMNKTLEYMAVGKPIVAFDLHETKISAGDSALYAKPNDIEDFALKVYQLLKNKKLRDKMGRIGKERIDKMYSWKYSVNNLIKAYQIIFNK